MCGVIGILGEPSCQANQLLYDGLTVLQHRGQDAAGIVTCRGSKLFLRKDTGLVRDVFSTEHMLDLVGNMGIGHIRYPTAGTDSCAEAQPFYVNSPYGITLAHNGNLINAKALSEDLFRDDLRHINTDSDSEILLNVFAHELQKQGKHQVSPKEIFQAVSGVHARCRGGYATVVMITGVGILGFRDPFGIRPIVFGQRRGKSGQTETMMASESIVLDSLGFDLVRDIQPGEAVFVDLQGNVHTQQCASSASYSPCIFEYVYLARPDSIIDNVSVYKSRLRMGEKLADKILREYPQHDIDVVIPIPDTSRTAALPMAYRLGVKYREGFIKNRYIGRTFIMPGQKARKKSVRQKLNAIDLEFKNKNVLLVDDSIVRGTTSRQIIQMAREAGAKQVYFASAAPPVRHANIYGIDMPAVEELVAYNRTVAEVATEIGADWLIYQDLQDLVRSVSRKGAVMERFDASCFDGDYVTGDVSAAYLESLGQVRSDQEREASQVSAREVIGIHNH